MATAVVATCYQQQSYRYRLFYRDPIVQSLEFIIVKTELR